MLHTHSFLYGLTHPWVGIASGAALTAARWGVLGLTWYTDTFFSAAAARRYRAIGQCIGFAAIVAVALGMTARIYLQHWVDREVAANLPPVAAVVEQLPSCDKPENMGKALEVSGLKTLTIRQLKATARGKVPGYGNMTKAQLVTALQGA